MAPVLVGPTDQAAFVGIDVTLSIEATGSGPFTAVWYDFITDQPVTGVTVLQYTVTTTLDPQYFYAIVTDRFGDTTQSDTAIVEGLQAGQINDQTEPKNQEQIDPGPHVMWRDNDMVGLAKAAEGPKPSYHQTYRFRGRIFRERDIFTNVRKTDPEEE